MSKGILQPDGSRCYKGADCTRHAAYNKFSKEAETLISEVKKGYLFTQPAPIKVKASLLREPHSFNVTNSASYTYDGSYCQGTDDEDEGICRDSVIEGLRMEDTDTRRVLLDVFGVYPYGPEAETAIPDELVAYGEELGMDKPDAYTLYTEGGYYGEEAVVELNPDIRQKLTEWYYNQDNANDDKGILSYCRSKGHATTGQSPLAAIKNQLNAENNGRKDFRVDKATQVSTKVVAFDKITVTQPKHYETVDSRPPVPANDDAKPFMGVLYTDGRGEYVLIDGYHRLKNARENRPGKGTYIILR